MRTILLISALLSSTALAQAPKPTPKAEGQATPSGASKWVQQLGSDRYRERLEAENELRKLGEAARGELERAAEDDGDSEVQWRAKRLLRQLQRGQTPAAPERGGLVERRRGGDADRAAPEIVERRSGARQGRVDDVRREFDRIFQRFEDMGLDVPSRRFFDDPFFRDLRSQMDGDVAIDGSSQSQSMSVQVGPGGVRVEVVEQGEDGKPETKVYEAPDMETFQKNHPGVLKGGGVGLGLGGRMQEQMDVLRGRVGGLQRGFDWDIARPRVLELPQAGATRDAAPGRGRVLGVVVKAIPDAVRAYLELGERGLMIERVQEGSLAAACGLRANDIVLEVGGREVASPADVAVALGGIKKGAKVRVAYLRKGARLVAEADKQHDAAAAPSAREPLRERK
ncbi:MAG: PDZ domain-containing protein [Planctomycetota bacterium]|nr:PDZ domain-containing protein [Planctomycetota bacterium]